MRDQFSKSSLQDQYRLETFPDCEQNQDKIHKQFGRRISAFLRNHQDDDITLVVNSDIGMPKITDDSGQEKSQFTEVVDWLSHWLGQYPSLQIYLSTHSGLRFKGKKLHI